MSFNLVTLEKAIRDRLTAGLAGVIQGSAHNTVAPDTARLEQGVRPLVVFTLVSGSYADSTFETNVASAVYQVAVMDHRANGMENLTAVFGRVYGDSAENGLSPTYGLHKWQVTGAAGIEKCRFEAGNFRTQHDAESLVYIQEFSVIVSEA